MKGTPLEVIPGILILILLVGCIQLAPTQEEENESACPDMYSPVCGVNNLTYQNSCQAQKAGITISYYGECKQETATCSDSDSGNNILEAGNATLGSLIKSDACINATHVTEYYCNNSQIASQAQACPSGYECSSGRCAKKELPPGCTDSDSGMDSYSAGQVTDQGKTYKDTCITIDLVKEYYCANGAVSSTNMACQSGYQCNNGACIEERETCSDDDYGKDPYKRGTTRITKGYLSLSTATDDCVNSYTVREYFCSNDMIYSEVVDCGSDYECDNGACKKLTCKDSDNGKDVLTKGETEKGSTSKTDRCSGTYNVEEYYCDDNDIESTIITCPSGRVCSSGRCVFEESCSETDGGNDLFDYGVTTKGSESSPDSCTGTYTIKEYYCSNNNIQSSSARCPSGYYCQGGECIVEPACSDSDGGIDYDVKGTATKGSQSSTDSCRGDTLSEYYCSSNQIVSTTYTCPYGCSNGACEEQPYCTDSDGGKDYLTKGTLIIGVDYASDRCLDLTTLREYYCTRDSYSYVDVTCTYPNQICSNGECVGLVLPP